MNFDEGGTFMDIDIHDPPTDKSIRPNKIEAVKGYKQLTNECNVKDYYFLCENETLSKTLFVNENSLFMFIQNILNSQHTYERFVKDDNILLFGHLFKTATALEEYICELLNLTYTTLYELEELVSSNNNNQRDKNKTENIVHFFNYIIYYVDFHLKDKINKKEIIYDIYTNLCNLKTSLKPLKLLRDRNIPILSCSQEQFHLHLTIYLHYLTICFKLLKSENDNDELTQCTQYISEYETRLENMNFNVKTIKNEILLISVELIQLVLTVFNKISNFEDLLQLAPFKCNCVMKFWFILKQMCLQIDEKEHEVFWENMNIILELMKHSTEFETVAETCEVACVELPPYLMCRKPYLFFIWFCKHLLSVNIEGNEVIFGTLKEEIIDFTENIVKKLTNNENVIEECELRVVLILLEKILIKKSSSKPDIILTLWEYFHKRLNSNFQLKHTPFAYNLSCLNNNRTVQETLQDIENLINETKKSTTENSFNLYLKLLGLYLLKYNYDQRSWNQIKGRMYSKFSQNKLSTLSDQGVKNLSNLFILLFYIKGNQEILKLQTFLNIILSIRGGKNDYTREIVLRTHLTAVLINVQNHVVVDAPIMMSIENLINYTFDHPENCNYEKIIKLYLQTILDILKVTDDLTLGQHLLFGSWMKKILNSKLSSHVLNLYYSVLATLMNKLKSLQPIQKDSPLGNYNQLIMENVIPNIQHDFNTNLEIIEKTAEFLCHYTLFTLSGGMQYKSETLKLLHLFIVNSNVNFELKMNYIKLLLSNEDMAGFSLASFIPDIETIITQCYVLNLILNEDENDRMRKYVETHNMMNVYNKYSIQHRSQQPQVTFSSNTDSLKHFLQRFYEINISISRIDLKNQYHSEVSALFSIEETLKYMIRVYEIENTPENKKKITNIFVSVGIILDEIGSILYKKSKPNSQLQCFLDTLLLQFQVRNNDYKLSVLLTYALRESFFIYIRALMKLDPNNDTYINRTIRELVHIYLPRLINKSPCERSFSFIKNFNVNSLQDSFLLNIIITSFLRKKCKVSDLRTHDCLTFLIELLNVHGKNIEFLQRFISSTFELLMNNFLSLNDIDVSKNKVKVIFKKCFTNSDIQYDSNVKSTLFILLSNLANENLVLSFSSFFSLLQFLVPLCPAVVAEFRKNSLISMIKAIEKKKGVDCDKVLRNGLEQLDRTIKKVILTQ